MLASATLGAPREHRDPDQAGVRPAARSPRASGGCGSTRCCCSPSVGLVVCSVIAIDGATRADITGEPHFFVYRQILYAGVGLVLMYLVSRIDYTRLQELRYAIYGLLIALPASSRSAIAGATRGAKAWIELPLLPAPDVRVRQGAARRRAVGLRRHPDAADGPPDDRADRPARADPDDARDGRERPRLRARLRGRDPRRAVHRRRAVAPLRRARGAVRGRDRDRARRRARGSASTS